MLILGRFCPSFVPSAPSDSRIGVIAPNGSKGVRKAVGNFLGHRCGSLDCHGQTGKICASGAARHAARGDVRSASAHRAAGALPKKAPSDVSLHRRPEPTVMGEVVANHAATGLHAHPRPQHGGPEGGKLFVPERSGRLPDLLAQRTDDSTACNNAFESPTFPATWTMRCASLPLFLGATRLRERRLSPSTFEEDAPTSDKTSADRNPEPGDSATTEQSRCDHTVAINPRACRFWVTSRGADLAVVGGRTTSKLGSLARRWLRPPRTARTRTAPTFRVARCRRKMPR